MKDESVDNLYEMILSCHHSQKLQECNHGLDNKSLRK